MLESLAASLLNRVLGSYVENFDPAQLNVGIWSGDVKLRNLKLRQDCLDSLNLPLDVKFGVLNDLALVVPWSSLKNNPVKIIIEDCFLLCSPRDIYSVTAKEELERELRYKLHQLAEWELANQARMSLNKNNNGGGDDSKNASFMQSLMTKVIDNLQITIKNIHIRYEDKDCLFSKYPCSLGITLRELSAVSTDENWTPKFIEIAQPITHKLFKMDSLCCYWNTNSVFLQDYLDETSDHFDPHYTELLSELKRNIAGVNSEENPNHQYLLKPITGEGHLSLNKKGSTDEQPHADLEVVFDEFTVGIDDSEYSDFLYTLSNITSKSKKKAAQIDRPTVTVDQDPLRWFKYVTAVVQEQLAKKSEMWTWDHIKRVCDQRREYIDLWVQKLKQPNLQTSLANIEDEERLDTLTRELTYEQIILFRTVARRQYLQNSRSNSRNGQNTETKKGGSWISSWWGGKSAPADDLTLTDEQRKELYDAIEFDENKDDDFENVIIPRDRVTMKFKSILNRGSFVMRRSKEDNILGEVVFEGCELQFLQRSDSYLGQFSLSEFRIEDGSPDSMYKHIISGRDLHKTAIEDDVENKDSLLSLLYESNPLDGISDSKLDIKLNGMTIFYHVHFISEVIKFFSMPAEHKETLDAIITAAEATVEGWTTYSRMGIESILEDHKTVNLSLDLQAPLIILPLHTHAWDTPCAVIDAGHISVTSDVIPKDKIKEIIEMSPEDYDSINPNEKNRLMFDRYQLDLQDTQILVGPNIQDTLGSLRDRSSQENFSVLEKLKLTITLDMLIVPKAYRLPRFKFFGHLPVINFAFNDSQYKTAIEILQKCIPSSLDVSDDDESLTEQLVDNREFFNQQQKQLAETLETLSKLSQAELEQNFLDVRFDIDTAKISISKCNNTEDMSCTKLVDIKGEKFQFEFLKRAKDMDVNIQIHSLTMEDFISSPNEEFKYLVASELSDSSKNSDLFSLKYNRKQRIVSYSDSLIELYDQKVIMDMKRLQLVLTPRSLLTLMNFMMMTFTDPNAPAAPADALRHNNEDNEDAPQVIDMTINMDGMNIILNDDSLKIATLVLSAADLRFVMLPEKWKFDMRMGGLELTDETSELLDRESPFRKIISMDDNELLELSYETFDSTTNTNNFDSILKYTTGSMVINFVESPINRIINYLWKFQRMKALFDSARQAAYNQAPSIETVNNMKLDILIKSPLLNFPKFIVGDTSHVDQIQIFLGEFFAQNSFSGDEKGSKVNHIKLGLRETKIISQINSLTSDIVSGMSLLFNVINTPATIAEKPTFQVISDFNPTSVMISDRQLRYILETWSIVSNSFTIDVPDEDELYYMAFSSTSITAPESPISSKEQTPLSETCGTDPNAIRVDFVFNSPSISLGLFGESDQQKANTTFQIAEFGLQDMGCSFKLRYDGTMEGEAHISAFTVTDKRSDTDNQFSELIPKTDDTDYQFVAKIKKSKLERCTITNVSTNINSPHVIIAMDFLFALKKFLQGINSSNNEVITEIIDNNVEPETLEEESSKKDLDNSEKFEYSVNIVDTAFILLADPSDPETEAVVFNIGQILLTDQNIITLATNNVNVFLTHMSANNNDKVRLLDDFSTTLTIDKRESTIERLVTNVQLSVQPLLMRISLRDIRLAMLIFKKATAFLQDQSNGDDISNQDKDEDRAGAFSKEFEKKLSKYVPSLLSNVTDDDSHKNNEVCSRLVQPSNNIENMTADFGGLRLILIGDVHEMPVLDMNATSLLITANNWSNDFIANLKTETFVNIFNYSRSCWEPFIENTAMGASFMKKQGKQMTYQLNMDSNNLTEVTLSTRSLSMLANIPKSLTGDLTLKPRGYQKPYKLVNETGLDLNIWIATENIDERKSLTKLESYTSLPWEFEEWQTVRERLSTDNINSILCVAVADDKYKSILKVNATDEGENMHILKPAVNGVHSRIVTECVCGEDNVKTVTFRSALVVENITRTPLIMQVIPVTNTEKEIVEFVFEPNQKKSVPVEYCYDSKLRFKPNTEEGYDWPVQDIFWKYLLDGPDSIVCLSPDDSVPEFNFEVTGLFNEDEPLSKIYPKMTIVISPSLIVENCLPYDMNFLLYEKKDARGGYRYLKKEQSVAIHDVSLRNFILLRLIPLIDNDGLSKPAIINTPSNSSLTSEKTVQVALEGGQKMRLSLHYQNLGKTRSQIIKIYAPYIIFNKTDRDLFFKGDLLNIAKSKILEDENGRYSRPTLFSFENPAEKNNKAQIKFRESDWCTPISFDALGQSFDAIAPIQNKEQEFDMGIHVTEGTGPYMMSKIVEIAPRYIIRNEFGQDIEICETGSINSTKIATNESKPLYKLSNIVNKQLIIKFLGIDSEWSSPFYVNEVGSTYLKVLQKGSSHVLLKINILLEKATLFIVIKDGGNHWPYSIRNFSDYEFVFYQRDPRIIDEIYDEDDENYDAMEYKPLYYRIPPMSVMPYSWDYPSAKQKKIIITSRNRKREIDMAGIGNLKPMRLPGREENEKAGLVDLNVVADGPTQALLITNYNPEVSLYKIRSKKNLSSASLNGSGDAFVSEEDEENMQTRVVLSFAGIGISLINAQMKEIMYFNLQGIELRYNESDLYKTFSWKIKWFQVDNQLFTASTQNIIYPTAVVKSQEELDNHPIISGSVSKVKDDTHGIPYYKHVTVLMQELSIQLDEDFMYSFFEFLRFPGAPWNVPAEIPNMEYVKLPEFEDLMTEDDIFFEVLHVQPTLLHFSFARSDKIEENNEEVSVEKNNGAMYYVHMLSMTLGNINDAPIKLNSLLMDNVRVPLPMLVNSMKMHYGQQIFYQVHKILGSADCFGNPVGLFNTISSGVVDLFYEPYLGYMMNDSPKEIGVQIARGGASFAKKTVYGISDSMARFTGSLAKGLSITQGSEFQATRRMQQRLNKNGRNVFANSAQSFAATIGSGFTGIALDPYKGAQKEGAAGLVKGLGRGLLGLPTKTVIGFLDLTNNLSQRVSSSTSEMLALQMATRVRLPRFIGNDQIITHYDEDSSLGQYWLKTVNGGEFVDDEYLVHVLLPGNELVVIVSMQRICEINIKELSIMWTTEYPQIQGIVLERGGIHIKLKSQSEYFIPITDSAQRRKVYRNIAIAVKKYNQYCEAVL
ncbi:Intermembrane lipid transfer protein VPS13 [Nakaseomyces bracarensis]|uniref:Vacuolar protein sorting-associated protein n=1 Tax=Nakaseomyces bracarensis TaxID=273131 RepID=A0ABR4NSI2_9SACH